MEHPVENPGPGRLPESVAEWAAAMWREFGAPLAPPAARSYSAMAAHLARTGFAEAEAGTGPRWARFKRRARVVSSTFLSTWVAKLMGGVVTVAAATGGAMAAGVDVHDLLPFLPGDGSVAEAVVEVTNPSEPTITMPGGAVVTTPEEPPAAVPGGPITGGESTTTTTTTAPVEPTTTVPGGPTTTVPPVRPPLSPPVGPPG